MIDAAEEDQNRAMAFVAFEEATHVTFVAGIFEAFLGSASTEFAGDGDQFMPKEGQWAQNSP